jgi:hypothetical protein
VSITKAVDGGCFLEITVEQKYDLSGVADIAIHSTLPGRTLIHTGRNYRTTYVLNFLITRI